MRDTVYSTSRKSRIAVFFLSCLAVANIIGLYVHHEYRRSQLNRQLIAAITSGNDTLALSLLSRGADGTIRKIKVGIDESPGLWGWVRSLLYTQKTAASQQTSALLCYYSREGPYPIPRPRDKQELPLRLLEAGLPTGSQDIATSLVAACLEGHDRVVQRMLQLGADPNAQSTPDDMSHCFSVARDSRDICEFSHLTPGERMGSILPLLVSEAPCAEILLANHADVNAADDSGNTALITACSIGDDATATVLLVHHADVYTRNSRGETALPNAAHSCKLKLVKALVSAGSSVNEASNNGVTSLMLAVDNTDERVLPWLLYNGANVNAKTTAGLSPLLIASLRAKLDVVKTLVRNGANLRQTTVAGETAAMLACDNPNEDVLPWLLSQNPDLDAKTRYNARKSIDESWWRGQHRSGETLLDYMIDVRKASDNDPEACIKLDRLIKTVRSKMQRTSRRSY